MKREAVFARDDYRKLLAPFAQRGEARFPAAVDLGRNIGRGPGRLDLSPNGIAVVALVRQHDATGGQAFEQPRARGGDNSGGNLVSACGACNTRKGHRRLAEFLADDPQAAMHFFRLARRHVWPRHLAAVEEELRGRRAGRPRLREP